MNLAPQIRLHLYFARHATLAVILRQGPRKLSRLILWNQADDSFIDGQWLKSRVYAERCDISADGRYFLYFALDGHWGSPTMGSYTALSRSPWFTALALYPQGDTWGGGGRFLDAQRYLIDSDPKAPDIIGRADGTERVFRTQPDTHNTLGFSHRNGRRVNLRPKDRAYWAGDDSAPGNPLASAFATEGGRLYRRTARGRDMIRDVTDMHFEPLRAPYDWRVSEAEPAPKTWPPLDRGQGA